MLDGLDAGQIAERYAPQQGDKLLVSRLLDGTQVTLGAARVESGLQQKIRELEAAGCQVILLLCTGEFGRLQAEQALLLEPDRIIPPLISRDRRRTPRRHRGADGGTGWAAGG